MKLWPLLWLRCQGSELSAPELRPHAKNSLGQHPLAQGTLLPERPVKVKKETWPLSQTMRGRDLLCRTLLIHECVDSGKR